MSIDAKQESVARSEERVVEARREGDPHQIAVALADFAAALVAAGDRAADVRRAANEALPLARDGGNRELEARLQGLRGVALASEGKSTHAEEAFVQALNLIGEEGHVALRSDALANLGTVVAEQGRLPEGLVMVEEAVNLAQSASDDRRLMAHLGRLGVLYLSAADADGATAAFEQATRVATELGDGQAAAGYMNNIGLVSLDAGDSERVMEVFAEVAQRAAQVGDPTLEASAWFQLAKAHMHGHRFGPASVAAAAALDAISDSTDEARRPNVEILLEALLRLEQFDEAVELARSELDTVGVNGDASWRLRLQGRLGDGLYGLGDLAAAEAAFLEALQQAQSLDNAILIGRTQGRLGAIYADQGRIDESTEMLTDALAASRENKDHGATAEQLYLLALNSEQTGETVIAIEQALESVYLFRKMGAEALADEAEALVERLNASR